jgi:hypothetical protein
MVEEPRKKSGCVKLGCFGCAGAVVLGLVLLGSIVGLGLLMGRPERRPEHSQVEQAVPTLPVTPPFSTDVGDKAFPLAEFLPTIDEPGRVVLDLQEGEFEIVAGDAPGPIRVEGSYDTAVYELVTEFERYGETGWVYHIRFERKIGWFRMLFNLEDDDNRVRIVLPREVPMTLEGEVGMGQFEFDLGGLWLQEIDLSTRMGEFVLDFDEPLLAPMKRFRLVAGMGDARVNGLGHASPEHVYASQKMGSLQLDLRGDWVRDATVQGHVGMGDLTVRLPQGVNVKLDDVDQILGSTELGGRLREEHDENAPTLSLRLSQKLGSIQLSR